MVRAKHQANLLFILDDLAGWEAAMIAELGARKFRGAWVRIHDSGDYFSDEYLESWLRVCRARPDVRFYCYTKEISRFRRFVEPEPPPNLLWVYSFGGTQDHSLDPTTDRVADVFLDEQAITEAGWSSQEASDLLAVLGPRLVGIPANRNSGRSSADSLTGASANDRPTSTRSTPNAPPVGVAGFLHPGQAPSRMSRDDQRRNACVDSNPSPGRRAALRSSGPLEQPRLDAPA